MEDKNSIKSFKRVENPSKSQKYFEIMNTAFQNLRKAARDVPKEKVIILHGYIRKQKDQNFNVVSTCLQKGGPRAK